MASILTRMGAFGDPRSSSHLSSFMARVVSLCSLYAGRLVLNCRPPAHLVSRACLSASLLAKNGQCFTVLLPAAAVVVVVERQSPS